MRIHFIGIGGIGTSALAKYYLSGGHAISGSDLASSEITDELEKLGVAVKIGKHKKTNLLKKVDLVVYTAAIAENNIELEEAKKRKIIIKSYAEAIGDITKNYKTIAISGAHGKSTTTALSALVLEEGYFDPTVIVGTKVREFGDTNFRRGYGSYFVLEADEWNKSFLNYFPQIAIITNIDVEHLDTYKTAEAVENTFVEYLERVPQNGAIIANADDLRLKSIAKKFGKKVHWYSLKDPEAPKIKNILKIYGDYNVSNALAAYTLGRFLGIRESDIYHAFSRFSGVWRRFEFKGLLNGAFIFSDYAHHPTEIRATLKSSRERFPLRKIWCIYQPHQYQRLQYLWDEFADAFDAADNICFLPVYEVAGRETEHAKHGVNSEKLTHVLMMRGKNACHFDTFSQVEEHIRAQAKPGDVIIVMGAGNIYMLTQELTKSKLT